MRLVFFGSGAFGLPTLEALSKSHDIVAVVTQPDKPAGRGSPLTPTPIGAWAAANLPGAHILKPPKVNAPDKVSFIRDLGADAWVVIAFGQKLSPELLKGVFAINLHASLLPRWRGAAPINAAIIAGDEVTGNSVITLADRMDAGQILGTSRRTVDDHVTAGEMHDLLSADGAELVLNVLAAHRRDKLEPRTQDESAVTLAGKFTKADGRVDWSSSARMCLRRIHGLTPWPGVTVLFRGQPMKLLRAALTHGHHQAPSGSLVDVDEGTIACGGGSLLKLLEVQPAGGRAMIWGDFSCGRRPVVGDLLETPPAEAEA
ncbi:MAG: methionyl-tRNA formyltransferase [Phycisphaerae bacterium]|jgi:methionyl-tRNA formyltransferase